MQQITELDLFKIFVNEEYKNTKSTAKCANCLPIVASKLNIVELSETKIDIVQTCWRKFQHSKTKYKKKGGYNAVLQQESSEVKLEHVAAETTPKKVKVDESNCTPSNYKSFDTLSRKRQLRRTNEIFGKVSEFAAFEKIDVIRLLGLLLTRCSEKDASNIGQDLWTGKYKETTPKLPIETSLAVYTDCSLGRQTYTKMKRIFSCAGMNILPA